MTAPTFTVVVPAYNEAELIGSALESVLRQSRDDWEAVVVDDGSTDDTAARAAAYERRDPRFRLMSQENAGLSAARNAGIEQARGGYVAFLDADDLLMPSYLERMGGVLDRHPSAGFAYTDAWAMDARTHRFRRSTAMAMNVPPANPPEDPAEFMRELVRANFVFVSTTTRREVLGEVGPFDVSLTSCEDYDMWLRILLAGHGAVRAPGILAIRRERASAMSQNSLRMIENLGRVCGRVADNAEAPEEARAAARERLGSVERWRRGLSGESRLLGAGISLRSLLGRARRVLRGDRDWLPEPPAEVRAAFPDIERL